MIQLAHPVETEADRAFRRGKFGMLLFFASLSMLFGALLVGLFVLRQRDGFWRSSDMAGLPWELWVSTALLAFGSYQLWRAQRAAIVNEREALFGAVRLATFALLFFLVAQASGWVEMTLAGLPLHTQNLYSFSFYSLTALHAAHVIGGFVPLRNVWRAAREKRYGPDRHAGLTYCAMYWHYLGGVWLVILICLYALA